MKSLYTNYIFDFDGTIANLIIDWDECRELINMHCSEHLISGDYSLAQKIVKLGQISNDYLDIIYNLETRNGELNYSLIEPMINFIKSLDQEIYIISNNHSQTIKDILCKEDLIDRCKKIVGIDDVAIPKPSKEPFQEIKLHIDSGSSIYIGDKETDKQFAECSNLDFTYANQII